MQYPLALNSFIFRSEIAQRLRDNRIPGHIGHLAQRGGVGAEGFLVHRLDNDRSVRRLPD